MSDFEKNGWRQGTVLARELAQALHPDLDEDELLVIVSQDCDLTHPSLDAEPTFEAIVVRRTANRDANLEHGKNPRKLQIVVGEDRYQCSMIDRLFLDREKLLHSRPDDAIQLGAENRRLLAKWMGLRYSRSAFPTEFNNRLAPNGKRVYRAQKACDALSGLYLYLPEETPSESEDYRVVLIGLYPPVKEPENESDVRERSLKQLDALSNAINACDGVVVEEHDVRSEAQITLAEIALLERWDVDFLSDRQDPPGPIAARPKS